MISNYNKRVCIITGASSGIGAALARELNQRGARVVLFARREDRLQALAGRFDDVLVVVGDVGHAADRQRIIDATLERFGRIDCLINNAGRGDGAPGFASLTAAQIESVMAVNLLGAMQLTHAALPHLLENRAGLIINVSSPMAFVALQRHSLYNTSKAGLSAFSLSLLRELKGHGVHVMDLRPGFTRSGMIDAAAEANLPPRWLMPIGETDALASKALDAALKGRPHLATGGLAMRVGTMAARIWPDLATWVLQRTDRFIPSG